MHEVESRRRHLHVPTLSLQRKVKDLAPVTATLWHQILLGSALFLVCLLVNLPELRLARTGLDASWMRVLNVAFEQHWQFGTDLVFTYGPLGFLGYPTPDLESLYALSASVFLGTVAWFSFVLTLGKGDKRRLSILLFSLVATIPLTLFRVDTKFFLIPVFAFILSLVGHRRMAILLFFCSGMLGHVKLSYALAGFALSMLATQIRHPLPVGAFLGGFLITYLSAGQSPHELFAYVRHSAEIVSGYSAAMVKYGDPYQVLMYIALTILASAAMWRQRGPSVDKTISVLGFLFIAFLIFKSGYVRHSEYRHFVVLAELFVLIWAFGIAFLRRTPAILVLSAFSLVFVYSQAEFRRFQSDTPAVAALRHVGSGLVDKIHFPADWALRRGKQVSSPLQSMESRFGQGSIDIH